MKDAAQGVVRELAAVLGQQAFIHFALAPRVPARQVGLFLQPADGQGAVKTLLKQGQYRAVYVVDALPDVGDGGFSFSHWRVLVHGACLQLLSSGSSKVNVLDIAPPLFCL